MLSDSFGRSFQYLRLSVTDICNFRCVYCLPHGYQRPKEVQAPLSVSEIKNLVSAFSTLGLWKVRLTGGEPTVRPDIVEIVQTVAQTPGIQQVALTTNGYRLKKLAPLLRQAGLTSLNVSVDSLNPKRFQEITGGDRLSEVLDGIQAAFEVGFLVVKINVVLLKDSNADELDSFLSWTKREPVRIRFIELMQTGENQALFDRAHLSASVIQNLLLERGWRFVARQLGDGPAQELSHPDYQGRIGLIAPYSKDFCSTCNRLRVSSTGGLRLCLFGEKDEPLRPFLQRESQREALIERVLCLMDKKRSSHRLQEGIYGNTANLAAIGG